MEGAKFKPIFKTNNFRNGTTKMEMMQHEHFLIIDDFLEIERFIILNNFLQSLDFKHVHSDNFQKAFGLNNNPFWSNPYLSHKREDDLSTKYFPTEEGIDCFLEPMLSIRDKIDYYVGKYQKQWDFFFCRPYLYPRETYLDWHTDGKYGISGAYVFFAHKKWHHSWGGDLLIDSKTVASTDYPKKEIYKDQFKEIGYALDNKEVNKQISEPGYGSFIYPKPNRLIIFKPKIWHKISPVSLNAGENYRLSLTGFFMKNEEIKKRK